MYVCCMVYDVVTSLRSDLCAPIGIRIGIGIVRTWCRVAARRAASRRRHARHLLRHHVLCRHAHHGARVAHGGLGRAAHGRGGGRHGLGQGRHRGHRARRMLLLALLDLHLQTLPTSDLEAVHGLHGVDGALDLVETHEAEPTIATRSLVSSDTSTDDAAILVEVVLQVSLGPLIRDMEYEDIGPRGSVRLVSSRRHAPHPSPHATSHRRLRSVHLGGSVPLCGAREAVVVVGPVVGREVLRPVALLSGAGRSAATHAATHLRLVVLVSGAAAHHLTTALSLAVLSESDFDGFVVAGHGELLVEVVDGVEGLLLVRKLDKRTTSRLFPLVAHDEDLIHHTEGRKHVTNVILRACLGEASHEQFGLVDARLTTAVGR
mmetsp:Transcript_14918/g.35585  ORF Transcript_14918/g.35585 Transcript_14918/m.35585 type:complete len:376 (-) Transcript_14918:677-1804(-)